MLRRTPASMLSASILLASASVAPAAVGNLWSTEGIGSPTIVGDISPDPGLECFAIDPLGSFAFYSLGDGQRIDDIPAPFDDRSATTYIVRDFDGNGLAEVLCIFTPLPGGTSIVGLLAHDGRGFLRPWPDLEYAGHWDFLGECDLSPTETRALVARGSPGLVLVSSRTGTVLYDSDDDPDLDRLPLDSILIDDFNGDGYEEILAGFLSLDGRPGPTTLIGDSGQASAAGGLEAQFGVLLKQSRPNPASGPNGIAYELADAGQVSLKVYDVAGRLVRTLVQGHVAAGSHDGFWDGRDDAGAQVASGIYFYELNAAGQRQTQKILQVR